MVAPVCLMPLFLFATRCVSQILAAQANLDEVMCFECAAQAHSNVKCKNNALVAIRSDYIGQSVFAPCMMCTGPRGRDSIACKFYLFTHIYTHVYVCA